MTIDLNLVEHPKDLSKPFDEWFCQAITLAEGFKIPEVMDNLRKLDEHQLSSNFRLAVIGEIARGKSTLVNRLIQPSHKLPFGPRPTTATITMISASTKEQMVVHFPGGREEVRPLAGSSWIGLTGSRVLSSGEVPQVQLTLNNPWLQDLDLEIIDTPGFDGLTGPRAALIFKLLSFCDAVILVVNGAFPFSLTEEAFLKQALTVQHVPRSLVVVSKLDLPLEQNSSHNDKRQQLKVVQDRVAAKISPLIPVISSQPVTEDDSEVEILKSLRSEIEILVSKIDRKAWRSQRIAMQLTDQLKSMVEIAQITCSIRLMDITEKEEARRQLDVEIQKSVSEWEKIKQELARRRQRLEQKIREGLYLAQDDLINKAASQLLKATNPKLWWEKDLPFIAHEAFLNLAQKYRALLVSSIARDIRWLEKEAESRCKADLKINQISLDDPTEIVLNHRNLPLQDFERLNLFIKLGYGATTILTDILLSQVGAFPIVNVEGMLKTGGAIVTGKQTDAINKSLLEAKIEKQRQIVDQEMRQSIKQSVKDYLTHMSARLTELYEGIVQDMQHQQTSWRNVKYATFELKENVSDQAWQKLVNDATSLRNSILEAMYLK